MKKLTLLILTVLSLVQCQSQEKKEKEPMQTYTYKTDKRPIYVIGLTVPGPYELYINDIIAEREHSPGMHSLGVDINPYVLKSGKYKFRLRVFPMPSEVEKGGIQPKTATYINVSFDMGERNNKEFPRAKPGSYKLIQEYPIPKITQPVPYLDIAGEFEVELPYELEGWSNGQDLSKWDREVLQKKVVAHYEKLRTVLNDGRGEEYMKLWEEGDRETYIFNYTSEAMKAQFKNEDVDIIANKCKNNMLPLEDYEMKLYAYGKLVTLERKITQHFEGYDANIKGWSPLIRKYNGAVTHMPVKLYLPEGSSEFVILRK